MTYQDPNHPNNLNRPVNDPYARRNMMGSGFGLPLAIAAVALILGLFFFLPSNDRTTTAANETPVTRQVNPSTPTPAPAPTPPVKTQ